MKVLGLLGEKLSHSLSPIIHNEIFKSLELEAAYSLFETQPHMLEQAVSGIKALNIAGVNVTIPYKVKVINYLDSVSREVLRIGAVNTINNQGGELFGYNTDYTGFGRMLNRSSINIEGSKAVVLGTGGASKAVVTYLEDNNIADIIIVSRSPEEVKSFDKAKYNLISYRQLEKMKYSDLLINCTPCGMYPNIDCSPLNEILITSFGAVVDLVYNPSETLLMKYAALNGIKAVNGLYMLVEQAVAAEEIWLGHPIENSIAEKIYLGLVGTH